MRTPRTPKKAPKGWRTVFLKSLTEFGNVKAACLAAGVGRTLAYKTRNNNAAFARAWDDAAEEATDTLELEARRRAYEGTVKPVFHQGVECGAIREYSDTLMIFLLKANRPEKYRDNYDLKVLIEQLTRAGGAKPTPAGSAGGTEGGES